MKKVFYLILVLIVVAAVGGFFVINSSNYTVTGSSNNVLGPESAKVTIVEYSDFQCPFCGKAAPTMKQILEKYPNDVRIVYKHFPLPIHTNSKKAAEAAECAAEQGRFWEYHDTLFANQNALYTNMLKDYAKQIGLNTTQFNVCFDSGAMRNRVEQDKKEGESLGVRGTPAFFVNGKMISGAQPISVFEDAINKALSSF